MAFPGKLRELRTEAGLSQRGLAARTRRVDPKRLGVSEGQIASLETGRAHPTPRVIEVFAAALGVDPSSFEEYRLAQARAHLDERIVGYDAALRNLERIHELAPEFTAGSPLPKGFKEKRGRPRVRR